jgi:thioredoxin 1
MAEIADVTDDSFEREVMQSELPVLVDFWGDHCAACRQISPILSELAEERSSSLKIVKIHAAENATTSAKFGVRAMPTVLVFDQGTVRGQLVGARSKSDFVDLVDQARS